MILACVRIGIFVLAVGIAKADSPRSDLETGDILFHAGDNAKALCAYEIVHTRYPRNFDVLVRLARVHADIGFLEHTDAAAGESHVRKSLAVAETLLYLFPERSETHLLLAVAKGELIPFVGTRKKIELGKAIRQHAIAALSKDSSNVLAYVVLANFEREISRLTWFERAVANIVFGSELTGSLTQGLSFVHAALRFEPNNPFALYESYQINRCLGDERSAQADADILLLSTPLSAREAAQQHEIKSIVQRR